MKYLKRKIAKWILSLIQNEIWDLEEQIEQRAERFDLEELERRVDSLESTLNDYDLEEIERRIRALENA